MEGPEPHFIEVLKQYGLWDVKADLLPKSGFEAPKFPLGHILLKIKESAWSDPDIAAQ